MPPVDDRGAAGALEGTLRDFQIAIAGASFTTWEDITVERAIDAACGSFSVNVVSVDQVLAHQATWKGTRATRSQLRDAGAGVLFQLPFGPQDEVIVRGGKQTLITGRIDAIELAYDKRSGTVLQIGGRDAAADLVDCSATNKPGEWNDIKLEDLARELADPFGVKITATNDTGDRFSLFKLHESETAWSALERACRMRGLLCFSDAFGGLVIEAPGAGGLVGDGRIGEGENLNSAKLSVNDAERFSIYYVRGQRAGSTEAGDTALLAEGNALDAGIRRFRPLVVLAEQAVSGADAELRAQWEAIVRASRAHQLRCVVPGWRRPLTAELWRINTLVPVQIPSAGIAAELLIVQTTFRRSRQSGTTTELLLARPDAFRPQIELPEGSDVLAPPATEED